MLGVLRRLIRREGGGALVELAVALPLLVIILAATIDFGRVFRMSVSLTNAARAGALYGAQDAGRTIAAIQTTAVAATNETGVTAVASRLCQCATNAGAFSDTSPVNECTYSSCPAPGGHIVLTVTVTASKTFTTLMNVIPGMPTSFNLSRTATLRVAN